MDLRMPSVAVCLGTAALQAYDWLRVCTNYRGSGGLHFKSEKRRYIFFSGPAFSLALLMQIHLYGHAPDKLCKRSLSKNTLGGDSFLERFSEEHA
jgi:hypothetical protein